MQISKYSIIWLFVLFFVSSCTQKKRINPDSQKSNSTRETGIFNKENENISPDQAVHQVKILELLNTDKYSYLKVIEQDEPYWIATVKADYQIGDIYLYRGGLLKTHFHSDEYDRIFEKLYLVSEIKKLSDNEQMINVQTQESESNTVSDQFKKPDIPGLTDLSQIVSSPQEYKGKTVKIYGEVMKVNPDIMDRNWLHIKDGTADDFDFVITTQSFIPVGHAIAFEGSIAINKDFGAGYTYAIIMENAKPIK